MNVYPITFHNADGTTFTAELVVDVSLPANTDWTIGAAGNGLLYSAYPVPPPPNLSWATISNLLNQNASVSINILTTYVTPTTGVTLALAPGVTLPTGWAFNPSTNLLTYNGTSVSGPVSVRFIATLTSTSATSPSNTFTVSGVGSTTSDNVAPTIPLGVAISSILQTTATISGLASSDPAPAGKTWSGMKQYNVTIPGAPGSPFTVNAPDVGTHAPLTFGDIGPQTSTITQSGADLTFTTTAVDAPYPTNSALAYAAFQLSGTSGSIRCTVPSTFTSAGTFDNLRCEIRGDLTGTGPYMAAVCNNLNGSSPACGSEYRLATGGNATKLVTSPTLSAQNVDLRIDWSGNTYTPFYSLDGNTWQSLGSQTVVLANPFYVVFGANTAGGGPMTAQTLKQCSIQVDPNWSLGLTGLTASTSYAATVTAQDTAGNISAASTSVSFTTAAASATGLADPVTFFSNGGGNQVNDYVGLTADPNTGGSATVLDLAAKFNYDMCNWFPGLETAMLGTSKPMTLQQSMALVKTKAIAIGNTNCATGYYNNDSELTISGDPRTALVAACNAFKWWVYSGPGAFPSGSQEKNGTSTYWTSRTTASPIATTGLGSDWAAGNNYEQASPIYFFNCEIAGNGAGVGQSNAGVANSQVNFQYGDNQFSTTRAPGQWLCTSTVYAEGYPSGSPSVDPYLQRGYAQRITKWRGLVPSNVMLMGNGDWYVYANPLFDPSVIGLYDAVLCEHVRGNLPFCPGNYNSPAVLLSRLARQQQLLSTNPRAKIICSMTGGPTIGVLWPTLQSAWTGTFTGTSAIPNNNGGSTVQTGTYWQAARAQFALAMMAGGMIAFADGNTTEAIYSYTWYLDEMNKSGAGPNWLGAPIDPPQTVPWQNGVYRRRYANGIVYYNPIGNGNQTITATGHFLSNGGYSDPSINNGASFTSFVIHDEDGRVTLP